jgi:hypothetical protein
VKSITAKPLPTHEESRRREPASIPTTEREARMAELPQQQGQHKSDCPCGGGCPRCAAQHVSAYEFDNRNVSSQFSGSVIRRKCACEGGLPCPKCEEDRPFLQRYAISHPSDAAEIEADRVAEQLMRPEPQTGGGGKNAYSTQLGVQRRAAKDSASSVPPLVAGVIGAAGASLDAGTRAFFEPRLGLDLSQVRIHADARAAASAQAINAHAYTVGHDVVFGRGQYDPASNEGRKLIAHELAHVVQQNSFVHRACDKALVGGRTEPVFFPKETKILDVFAGTSTLNKTSKEEVAIGLVQQALTDLCRSGGIWGPNKDGVDRKFEKDTETAVKDFQKSEGLTDTGEVDKDTLRCLDETRSKRISPCKTSLPLADKDLLIESQRTGGRDEDIFFARGSKALDSDDEKKIEKVADKNKGKALTLTGFESEDEVVDFGNKLAQERIDEVKKNPKLKPHLDAKLLTDDPKPLASGGALAYRTRRKVEIGSSTTPDCKTVPSGWVLPDQGPCDAATDKIIIDAIDHGVKLMDKAIGSLKPGDATAEGAVADRFGSKTHLPVIKTNLTTWRDYLNTTVRANHICTNACHGACVGTAAYTDGSNTFLCASIMKKPTNSTETDEQALLLVHEAGHGALSTMDLAYDTTRMLSLIQSDFSLAKINTDSYVLLVQCLNGITIKGLGCKVPPPGDKFPGLSGSDKTAAEESLAWLERWMDFVWQDVNNLYPAMRRARNAGAWLSADSGPKGTMDLLSKHLGLHRPEGSPAPTFREEIEVAAIHDRYARMMVTTEKDTPREFVKDPAGTPEWKESDKKIIVKPAFFTLGTRRAQVRFLVELVVKAQSDISATMVPGYVDFTDNESKSWVNKP